jgi:hypothetical protein
VARKPKTIKRAKGEKLPGEGPTKLTALPDVPFALRDRGAYIDRPWVAVEKLGKEYLGSIFYAFAQGTVQACAVNVNEIDLHWQGGKQFHVDGAHTGFGPRGQAQTSLQWLKNRALQSGASPEAIRLLKLALPLTKKEEDEMAKAATNKKLSGGKSAGDKPVGKGGKVAAAKGGAGNAANLEKARAAAAARNAENHAKKIGIKVTKKDTTAEGFKLRGGRLAKLLWVIENKPKTVGDAVGNECTDSNGDTHKIDMGALRGMEKRGHITIG